MTDRARGAFNKGMRAMLRALNDVVRFSLELTALVAFALWGTAAVRGDAAYVVAGVAVLFAAGYWGLLIAPKAKRRLGEPARLVAELWFFSLAGWAAFVSGHVLLAEIIVPLSFASCCLLRVVGTAAP